MTTQRPRIALLAAPETTPSVLFGLYDVLISVGAVYPDMVGGQVGEALLDVQIVAAVAQPFRCFGNILIEPHAAIGSHSEVDAVIVCDMYTPTDRAPHGRYGPEIAWLQRMHAQGALVASVCSGSLVLAEAGLLDGRSCAGHWAYRELFRRRYPKVDYCADSILRLDSEAQGVVTAGGVTAWQDLALHLISRYCGPEHALQTAKVYLLSGHEDGQLPFADRGLQIQDEDHAIKRCQQWIAEHVAQVNPVEAMTRHAGLTRRTFTRRFRAATGYLPMDYVHALRIERAKRIIEARQAGGLDAVASEVGYEDPSFFRRLFKREVGLTPAAYRKKFSSLLG
ncbi:GlxA family transcriptional regulator [Paucibacter sp. JuS9]|uniref:GlxA family transcriptional regulator n=1 Tax=Paucibacter sp. JuS9 TaxID=3228748 RepID=UPI00375837E9